MLSLLSTIGLGRFEIFCYGKSYLWPIKKQLKIKSCMYFQDHTYIWRQKIKCKFESKLFSVIYIPVFSEWQIVDATVNFVYNLQKVKLLPPPYEDIPISMNILPYNNIMYCFSRTEISIPCWLTTGISGILVLMLLADLFNLWRFGSVSLDSRLERTTLQEGHCSLGSQFEDGLSERLRSSLWLCTWQQASSVRR